MPAAAFPRTRKRAVLAALAASALIVPYGALVTDFLTPYQEVPAPYYPPTYLIKKKSSGKASPINKIRLLPNTLEEKADRFVEDFLDKASDLWSSKSADHREQAMKCMSDDARASYLSYFKDHYNQHDHSPSAMPRMVVNRCLWEYRLNWKDVRKGPDFSFLYGIAAVPPESSSPEFFKGELRVSVEKTENSYKITEFSITPERSFLQKSFSITHESSSLQDLIISARKNRCRQLDEKVVKALIDGWLTYENGNVAESIKLYDEALAIEPNLPMYYAIRAGRKSSGGNLKGAVADYTKAIELTPDDASLYKNRGSDRYDLGDYKGCVADYDQLEKLDPNYPRTHLLRGASYRALGDYKKALADFDRLLERDDQLLKSLAHYHKAKAFHYMPGKDDRKAMDEINSAIALNKTNADFYCFRGWLRQVSCSDLNGAIADLNQALMLDPCLEDAYTDRASIYTQAQAFDHAMRDAEWALFIESDSASGFMAKSWLHSIEGKPDLAIQDLNKALSTSKDWPDKRKAFYLKCRAESYMKLFRFDKAFADIAAANKLAPGEVDSVPLDVILQEAYYSYMRAKLAFHTHNKKTK